MDKREYLLLIYLRAKSLGDIIEAAAEYMKEQPAYDFVDAVDFIEPTIYHNYTLDEDFE